MTRENLARSALTVALDLRANRDLRYATPDVLPQFAAMCESALSATDKSAKLETTKIVKKGHCQ